MRIGQLALALIACASVCAAADESPSTDPLSRFEEGAIICARDDTMFIGAGIATIPFDARRGACWKYDGESTTGKARLMIIEGRTPLPLGFPSLSARPDLKDKAIKVEPETVADHFVVESSLPAIKSERVSGYLKRWPDLSHDQAEGIWSGQVWIGMAADQAEESVGWLIHKKSARITKDGHEDIWQIGFQSLPAQIASEAKKNSVRDILFGPGARSLPVSPTAAAIESETIEKVLTFVDQKLTAIEAVTH